MNMLLELILLFINVFVVCFFIGLLVLRYRIDDIKRSNDAMDATTSDATSLDPMDVNNKSHKTPKRRSVVDTLIGGLINKISSIGRYTRYVEVIIIFMLTLFFLLLLEHITVVTLLFVYGVIKYVVRQI
ncbi:hypothetical protein YASMINEVIRUS_201 [Yasminevirus sp. GU-2018]|uniref:Uncharacterized protein n=1 Tax=Yasminevirus sp. GU-2018 TaxID=2420051 RepID=A0A5K0U754_9VIRU|nr:hypothetical protein YASMINEVIRUS_201 [Yasminevirus sp. GU-2018]